MSSFDSMNFGRVHLSYGTSCPPAYPKWPKSSQRADEYLKQFGTVPQFRASLHCGIVVAGEMGDWKREVGFIGDTVNTAARILDACTTNNRDFIVSEEVLQRTADIERYTIEVIPESVLRGRQGKVTLFGVERKNN